MAENYPIGCRFRPAEEELLLLLREKVTNPLFLPDEVKEKTVYGKGASPWDVFADDDLRWEPCDESGKNGNKKMVYVFTELNKLSAKKTSRTAGSGTWDGENKATSIDLIEGCKIGSRKMFSYVLNSGSQMNGSWTMHEYSLDGAYLNGIDSSYHNTNYVICRIIKDDSKFTKVKTPAIKKRRCDTAQV